MVQYIRIGANDPLPDLRKLAPYKAIVIIESDKRQEEISRWLVESGCLYMMAWGPRSTTWDDSVDHANLEQFGFGDIPDDSFVMTTWHDDESLEEVFRFSKTHATHASKELSNTVLLHLAEQDQGSMLTSMYDNA